jgi:hypothetical protein
MSQPDYDPSGPEAQGLETSELDDAARVVNPDPDQTAPGDSKDVPVAHDEAMEGTSEEYSSIEKARTAPPTGETDG